MKIPCNVCVTQDVCRKRKECVQAGAWPKQRKRIPPKRKTPRTIHPERSGGHLRVRLHGAARQKRRAEIFDRAGGMCEDWLATAVLDINDEHRLYGIRCHNRATEWSHKKHGARKCDCMDCGIASCAECHRKRHNPKPCPKKPEPIGKPKEVAVG